MADENAEKPAEEQSKPRVIYNMVDKDVGRIRIVACGKRLAPEKYVGTDAMGVEAWVMLSWDRWCQPIAEKHLGLLALSVPESEAN